MSHPHEPSASAPLPANEEERLAALRSLGVLDTPPEPVFDRFVQLAAAICGTPIGLISLIDRDRQWFKARVGLEMPETPRQTSFCAHTILGRGVLVVPDATIDPRFAHNPNVLADPHVRFYAGQPLVTAQGHALGALCVIDHVPRKLTAPQLDALGLLARQVVEVLELQRRARRGARAAEERRRTLVDNVAATERRDVERLKDEFVSTVSHELRTPLTSIRGALGLLRAGVMGELPAEAGEVVAIAERNSERLLALIDDILDIERLRAGPLELVRGPLAADELVAHAVEATRGVARVRGVRLESDVCPDPVYGDRARLAQVLVNLLSNAVKFSPEGGLVRVEARRHGADVVFRVSDRGRGIPREYHEAIFERFRQVEATDAREMGGSGLGLALCRALVEQHGGMIGVESEPGAGSTFWVQVPAATEEA